MLAPCQDNTDVQSAVLEASAHFWSAGNDDGMEQKVEVIL